MKQLVFALILGGFGLFAVSPLTSAPALGGVVHLPGDVTSVPMVGDFGGVDLLLDGTYCLSNTVSPGGALACYAARFGSVVFF